MNKPFYVIYNQDEQKFLSRYEDGEGTEWYSTVDFDNINNGGIFESKERAESVLNDVKNIAGFSKTVYIEHAIAFLMDCSIREVQIKFLEEL